MTRLLFLICEIPLIIHQTFTFTPATQPPPRDLNMADDAARLRSLIGQRDRGSPPSIGHRLSNDFSASHLTLTINVGRGLRALLGSVMFLNEKRNFSVFYALVLHINY